MSIKLRIAGAFVSLKTTLPGQRALSRIERGWQLECNRRPPLLAIFASACVNKQRVAGSDLWLSRDMRRASTASDGLKLPKAWLGVSFR